MDTNGSASENDEYGNSDDEETEGFEQKVDEAIRNGDLVVKNADDTYKCPLSPGRKKQSYRHWELLAHATGLANGKKGPEKVGGHRALMKYLQAELGDKPRSRAQAESVLYLEQAVPKRAASTATRLLAPWMGILVNIDNRRGSEQGFKQAVGAADIKAKFKEYNPENVEVFHDYRGHQGTALLTFRNDIHGLEDAQAFQQSFAAANRGSKEWWDEECSPNLDLYGWQATEEDLTAKLGKLRKVLCKSCDLKTVKDMVEEQERLNKQLVRNMEKTVDEKADMAAASHQESLILRNKMAEVDAFRVKAVEDMKKMEEQHKQDLEEMQLQSQAKEAAHREKVSSHEIAFANKLRTLESRCEAMKEAEMQMRQKNEAERQQFEREMQEVQKQLEEASKQAKLHAVMQCKQRDEQKEIIKKHECENKALEMAVQEQKRNLMQKQQLELQTQHVKELLEIEKSSRETDKDKISELESEQEWLQGMVNTLTLKERTSNDQLVEARKVAVEVLERYGAESKIGNKLQGSINKGPWKAACKKKYKYHPEGYEISMSQLISVWETRIMDQSYHPFKTLNVKGDTWKRIVDEDDEFLKKLKEHLGAEVMQTVATAFLEIEEYNASGRYPVHVAWDFEKNQRVLLKDLLLYLKDLLDSGGKLVKKMKRGRGVQ